MDHDSVWRSLGLEVDEDLYLLLDAGRDVLNGSAVTKTDPIRWSYPNDAEVLRVRVLRSSREVNSFEAFRDPDSPSAVDALSTI